MEILEMENEIKKQFSNQEEKEIKKTIRFGKI